MRSLVIYDARYENSERAARAIAEGLNERGQATAVALGRLHHGDVEAAQLVVLGTPNRARRLPQPMRKFLHRADDATWFARPVAVFETRVPGDAKRTAATTLSARLRDLGALIVVPPESFFVTTTSGPLAEGELARARVWGRQLHLGDRVATEE